MRVHEIILGKIFEGGNVIVTAFAVPHGDWETAFGYRFQSADRSIVISGDTRASDAVVRAYHAKAYTSTTELADIARRAAPKQPLLYHQLFWGTTDDGLIAEMRAAGYMGPTRSAAALTRY